MIKSKHILVIKKIIYLISKPLRVLEIIKSKTLYKFFEKEYISVTGNRSVSDNGLYVASIQESLNSYKNFIKFKRDLRYQAILEHCTYEVGLAYLEIIKKESPEFIKRIDIFKENDLVGGATTYKYKDIGLISPSTLRYIKVASDIKNIFGEIIGDRIAEIGCGYGGQLLIADKVLKFKQWDFLDLPPVLALSSKYIEHHTLSSSYHPISLNQHRGDVDYDLVISNYAFSELPSKLQQMYIEKILSKSKKGYLTMNSGKENSVFKDNKLSLGDLKKYLPSFEIIEERPLTAKDNYIIVWGRKF